VYGNLGVSKVGTITDKVFSLPELGGS